MKRKTRNLALEVREKKGNSDFEPCSRASAIDPCLTRSFLSLLWFGKSSRIFPTKTSNDESLRHTQKLIDLLLFTRKQQTYEFHFYFLFFLFFEIGSRRTWNSWQHWKMGWYRVRQLKVFPCMVFGPPRRRWFEHDRARLGLRSHRSDASSSILRRNGGIR